MPGGHVRIVIDTADHPSPGLLLARIETLLAAHDNDPQIAVVADTDGR